MDIQEVAGPTFDGIRLTYFSIFEAAMLACGIRFDLCSTSAPVLGSMISKVSPT